MFEAKNYAHLIGMTGFSDTLLTNHFGLYEGYVKNTNALLELLNVKEVGTPEYAELKRRFGWEWNGMRLHELYFGNMTKDTAPLVVGTLKAKIEETYGSFENWKKNFIGVGTMRGIGWIILTHDQATGELFNIWVNEHDSGHLAGTKPLLVMDVFEHAFVLDYGMKRIDYINAFFEHIDWDATAKRYSE